ncbi:unannotated protein [freshwater metagenome]|uniref:Unannotated protein n=1 Tax=freshwater metagenome TaxID=449393 RepID=A0A6J6IGN2_9ZZZZ
MLDHWRQGGTLFSDGLHRDVDATTIAVITRSGEDLNQALSNALTRHLHQAKGGDFSDLMLGSITAKALKQSTQNLVTVALKNHVDEVHDDDSANVTQTELANNFFRSFQVVGRDGFFQVSTLAGETTGVDVNDSHGFGAVNDQRTTRWQVDLAVQCLSQLLVNAEFGPDILRAGPLLQTIAQVRGNGGDIAIHDLPSIASADDDLLEVLIEDVADHANGHVGLAIQQARRRSGLGLFLHFFPLNRQALYIASQFLFARTFCGGTNDDAGVLRNNALERALQA